MQRLIPLLMFAGLVPSFSAMANDRDALAALESNGVQLQRDESKPEKPVLQARIFLRQISADVNQALKDADELPMVEFVGTGDTELAPATLRALQGKRTLKRLAISHARIPDDSAAILGTFKNLDALDFRAQIEISSAGVEHVLRLTNLKELTVSDRMVTDEVMEEIGNLSSLKILNVRSMFLTDYGIASLTRLKNLQVLRVYLHSDISADGIRLLSQLRLRELDVTYFNPDDAAVRELRKVNAMKALHLLNARGVTDKSIPYFMEMTELKELEILGVKLTSEGLKELKKSLPNCKISQGAI